MTFARAVILPARTASSRQMPALASRLRQIRFLPLETFPGVVSFVQTPLGKAALVAAEAAVLSRRFHGWVLLAVLAAATATAFSGKYRSRVLFFSTVGMLAFRPGWYDFAGPAAAAAKLGALHFEAGLLRAATLVVFFALSAMIITVARRRSQNLFVRRPVSTMAGFALLLILAGNSGFVDGYAQIYLWAFLATFVAYMWFLAYAVNDQLSGIGPKLSFELGTLHPFWGSTTVPYAKGAAYLSRVEAKTPEQLAVTQLKGLKLLLWVVMLGYAWRAVFLPVARVWQIPTIENALAQQAAGHALPWSVCWASTVFSFLSGIFYLTVSGNTIVAVARFAGFRLLRNTYRPLSARTIAEFFGRYYYYYKELLFEFFFMPTFVRYFRRTKRVRLLFATFIAAGPANVLFHFLRDSSYVADRGLGKALVAFAPFAFYCAVLGLAIGLSLMRSQHRHKPRGWIRGQLVPSLSVIFFYCVMSIFNEIDSPVNLTQHFIFMFRLLGSDLWM